MAESMNGLLAFGVMIAFIGVVQIAMAKPYGPISHQVWTNLGARSLAKTPEFWTKASRVFGLGFLALAAGFIVAGVVIG